MWIIFQLHFPLRLSALQATLRPRRPALRKLWNGLIRGQLFNSFVLICRTQIYVITHVYLYAKQGLLSVLTRQVCLCTLISLLTANVGLLDDCSGVSAWLDGVIIQCIVTGWWCGWRAANFRVRFNHPLKTSAPFIYLFSDYLKTATDLEKKRRKKSILEHLNYFYF